MEHDNDGSSTASVCLTRSFASEPKLLWQAITTSQAIAKWFLPIEGDLKLGGSFALQGHAHGSILECDPFSQFKLTWESGSDISWVNIDLKESTGNNISLILEHTMRVNPHWDQYGAGATGVGWEMCYLGIYLYLINPEEAKLDEAELMASDLGKHLVTTSSQGWAEASIAAGNEGKATNAAAKRTTAFYLGL